MNLRGFQGICTWKWPHTWHNHDYVPKFGTTIGVTIVDNVFIGICNYFVIKNKIFIFQVLEMSFFVNEVPQTVLKFVPFHFSSKAGHIGWPLTKFQ
jgi:hypothetical protein